MILLRGESEPEKEYLETVNKAKALINSLN